MLLAFSTIQHSGGSELLTLRDAILSEDWQLPLFLQRAFAEMATIHLLP